MDEIMDWMNGLDEIMDWMNGLEEIMDWIEGTNNRFDGFFWVLIAEGWTPTSSMGASPPLSQIWPTSSHCKFVCVRNTKPSNPKKLNMVLVTN